MKSTAKGASKKELAAHGKKHLDVHDSAHKLMDRMYEKKGKGKGK